MPNFRMLSVASLSCFLGVYSSIAAAATFKDQETFIGPFCSSGLLTCSLNGSSAIAKYERVGFGFNLIEISDIFKDRFKPSDLGLKVGKDGNLDLGFGSFAYNPSSAFSVGITGWVVEAYGKEPSGLVFSPSDPKKINPILATGNGENIRYVTFFDNGEPVRVPPVPVPATLPLLAFAIAP